MSEKLKIEEEHNEKLNVNLEKPYSDLIQSNRHLRLLNLHLEDKSTNSNVAKNKDATTETPYASAKHNKSEEGRNNSSSMMQAMQVASPKCGTCEASPTTRGTACPSSLASDTRWDQDDSRRPVVLHGSWTRDTYGLRGVGEV